MPCLRTFAIHDEVIKCEPMPVTIDLLLQKAALLCRCHPERLTVRQAAHRLLDTLLKKEPPGSHLSARCHADTPVSPRTPTASARHARLCAQS